MANTLKKLEGKNLTKASKHCQPEFLIWKEIKGQSIEVTLKSYFNLTVHLLCVLAEEREKLERLNKK